MFDASSHRTLINNINSECQRLMDITCNPALHLPTYSIEEAMERMLNHGKTLIKIPAQAKPLFTAISRLYLAQISKAILSSNEHLLFNSIVAWLLLPSNILSSVRGGRHGKKRKTLLRRMHAHQDEIINGPNNPFTGSNSPLPNQSNAPPVANQLNVEEQRKLDEKKYGRINELIQNSYLRQAMRRLTASDAFNKQTRDEILQSLFSLHPQTVPSNIPSIPPQHANNHTIIDSNDPKLEASSKTYGHRQRSWCNWMDR